jgi:hypothetical protein
MCILLITVVNAPIAIGQIIMKRIVRNPDIRRLEIMMAAEFLFVQKVIHYYKKSRLDLLAG